MSFPRHVCEGKDITASEVVFINSINTWAMNVDPGGNLVLIRYCPFCGIKLEVGVSGETNISR